MRHLALIIWLSIVGLAYGADEKEISAGSVITQALEKLTLRGKEEHPWVILTDSTSGHFVQFGFEHENLFIDVPLVGRTVEEKKKLEHAFRSIGVERPVVLEARDPKTLKSFTSRSYQADFSKDVKRAGGFASRILREVFGIDSPDIKVEEGSG